MHLHPADVKPGSRKEGSEDGIELTVENESRDTTLRKSELVTGSAVGNLGQKISLGDVASDPSFKKPERPELEVGTSGGEGPERIY